MEKLIATIFLICSVISLTAQETFTNHKTLKTIAGTYKNFAVDNLGNVYVINTFNQIKKLNSNFDSIAVFNDTRQYGSITHVDVTNPLKILVYYAEFSTILVLDRFLNLRNKIDLRKQNIFKASSIALSFDNFIWVYDEFDHQIKKINDEGNIVMQSNDFRLALDTVMIPQAILDYNGKLYLYQPNKGLLVLDYYGALQHFYEIKGLQNVQFNKNNFIGFTQDGLVSYSLNFITEQRKKMDVLNKKFFKILLRDQLCYGLSSKQLEVIIVE